MQSISPTRNEVIFDFIVNFGQLCGEAASMNVALLTQSPACRTLTVNRIDPRRSHGIREADSLFAKFAKFVVEKKSWLQIDLCWCVLAYWTQRKDRESGESCECGLADAKPLPAGRRMIIA